MSTRGRVVAVFGGGAVACALLAGACGGGDGESSSGGSSGTSGASGTSGTSGTATNPLCAPVAQLGDSIVESPVVGAAPPALGGTVTDGTYVLTARDAYGASPPPNEDAGPAGTDAGSSDVKRATMVIAGSTIRISGSRAAQGAPLPADVTTGATFTVVGTSLATTPACPAGPVVNIPYSAVGTGIALLIDATHRELYVRQ